MQILAATQGHSLVVEMLFVSGVDLARACAIAKHHGWHDAERFLHQARGWVDGWMGGWLGVGGWGEGGKRGCVSVCPQSSTFTYPNPTRKHPYPYPYP